MNAIILPLTLQNTKSHKNFSEILSFRVLVAEIEEYHTEKLVFINP